LEMNSFNYDDFSSCLTDEEKSKYLKKRVSLNTYMQSDDE